MFVIEQFSCTRMLWLEVVSIRLWVVSGGRGETVPSSATCCLVTLLCLSVSGFYQVASFTEADKFVCTSSQAIVNVGFCTCFFVYMSMYLRCATPLRMESKDGVRVDTFFSVVYHFCCWFVSLGNKQRLCQV